MTSDVLGRAEEHGFILTNFSIHEKSQKTIPTSILSQCESQDGKQNGKKKTEREKIVNKKNEIEQKMIAGRL